jgi:RNA polymerase sigma-70 factor (ECF subfamily)
MPPPKATTTDLLAKVAGGDRDALKSLYDAQSARLFGIVMAILRDRPAAGDALQDTMLRVWQHAGQHDPGDGDADTWLAAVARHAALDVARARGRDAPADEPRTGDPVIDADALEPLAAGVGARLRDRLRQLEPKLRQSIVLGYVHGLSQAEIAARLNEPPGAVKAWIRSGLHSLRDLAP